MVKTFVAVIASKVIYHRAGDKQQPSFVASRTGGCKETVANDASQGGKT
jgi:hypothetical protein